MPRRTPAHAALAALFLLIAAVSPAAATGPDLLRLGGGGGEAEDGSVPAWGEALVCRSPLDTFMAYATASLGQEPCTARAEEVTTEAPAGGAPGRGLRLLLGTGGQAPGMAYIDAQFKRMRALVWSPAASRPEKRVWSAVSRPLQPPADLSASEGVCLHLSGAAAEGGATALVVLLRDGASGVWWEAPVAAFGGGANTAFAAARDLSCAGEGGACGPAIDLANVSGVGLGRLGRHSVLSETRPLLVSEAKGCTKAEAEVERRRRMSAAEEGAAGGAGAAVVGEAAAAAGGPAAAALFKDGEWGAGVAVLGEAGRRAADGLAGAAPPYVEEALARARSADEWLAAVPEGRRQAALRARASSLWGVLQLVGLRSGEVSAAWSPGYDACSAYVDGYIAARRMADLGVWLLGGGGQPQGWGAGRGAAALPPAPALGEQDEGTARAGREYADLAASQLCLQMGVEAARASTGAAEPLGAEGVDAVAPGALRCEAPPAAEAGGAPQEPEEGSAEAKDAECAAGVWGGMARLAAARAGAEGQSDEERTRALLAALSELADEGERAVRKLLTPPPMPYIHAAASSPAAVRLPPLSPGPLLAGPVLVLALALLTRAARRLRAPGAPAAKAGEVPEGEEGGAVASEPESAALLPPV